MELGSVIKCLCWSFLLLSINEKIFCLNATSVTADPASLWQKSNRANYFIKQFKRDVEYQQQAAAKAQTFLELILGIIDTLQFGKRKLGTSA